MSLGWVITGSILSLMLCGFELMFALFGLAGAGNSGHMSAARMTLLGVICAIPLIACIVSAGAAVYCYKIGSPATAYRWYAIPLLSLLLYATLPLVWRD